MWEGQGSSSIWDVGYNPKGTTYANFHALGTFLWKCVIIDKSYLNIFFKQIIDNIQILIYESHSFTEI